MVKNFRNAEPVGVCSDGTVPLSDAVATRMSSAVGTTSTF